MATILIAGCGDSGSGLGHELVSQGHNVIGIRRTGVEFPAGVTGITGDLVTMEDSALPDADIIFLIMTPKGRTEEAYRAAYLDTAKVLIRRYQSQSKPPQIFFVSSTSVYGESQGEWIDETTPAQPKSATSSVLRETELALTSVFPTVAVRCSGIYGSGRFRLLQKIESGEDWGTNSWTNRIHRDDVVSALVTLAECAVAGKALPNQVIVTDQTPVSMWEVKLWLATCLGVTPAIKNSHDFIPASGKRIQGQYLLSQGWRPRYPSYVSGYQSLLLEYKNEGNLS
ncbi:MAG: NAD-dependent epimerase/dehydratase family protein [Marinomonas sp.]